MAHGIEEGHDGLYTLCVFDAETASDSELQDVFGEFGTIINLHRSKNLVFIRFGSLDAAVSCYENMQNQATYRVRPARKRGEKSDNLRNRNSLDAPQKKLEMSSRSNDRGNFSERRSDGAPSRFSGSFRQDNTETLRPKPRLEPVIPGSPDEDITKPTPKAKGVMIANIPSKMMQHEVIELCAKNKVSVLHVDMKTIDRPHYTSVYYANVYVKTDKDVQNLISGLNNKKLGNYMLFVNSTEQLADEC